MLSTNLLFGGALTMAVMSAPALAQTPMSIDIDQIRNGAADDPDETDGSPDWVNGGVGEFQGHLEEGWSISYRARIENIPAGCYSGSDSIRIVLGYDVRHSDRHAIDYLTSYNRLHAEVSECDYATGDHRIDPYFPDPTYGTPLFGGIINDPTDVVAIPCPECPDPYPDLSTGNQPGTSCVNLSASERLMSIWGGEIVGIYYADYPLGSGDGNTCAEGEEGDMTASQSEARVVVVIDPDGPAAVLAWGGHIGSHEDWGCQDALGNTVPCGSAGSTPRTAGGISGSPFHMRLIDWEGFAESNCPTPPAGDPDRALSGATVCVNQPLIVGVDIDPGHCPNRLNASRAEHNGKQEVDVAVVGSEHFDVLQIAPTSIRLEGVGPLDWSFRDVTAPSTENCGREKADGHDDLLLTFAESGLIAALGQNAGRNESYVLDLTGLTNDGTPITGSDRVVVHGGLSASVSGQPMESIGIGNYPNPFNAQTVIRYGLSASGAVRLDVFNILGQTVTTLVDAQQPAGRYEVVWDGRDRSGSSAASGVYFFRLQSDGVIINRKMLLLK